MPEALEKEQPNLIDVGEENGAEIDLDNVVKEEPKEEIVVEQIQEEEEKEVSTQETKTDELKDYSEGVNKRIAKLTKKMREAERQKDEALNYAKSVLADRQKLQSNVNTSNSNYVQEFERRVVSNLNSAKTKLKIAIDNQDVESQVEAQQEIAQLTLDTARLSQAKQVQESRAQRPVEQNYVAPQQQGYANPQQIKTAAQEMDPKAEAWASKNSWFGADNAMTYTAFDVHKKLTEEEGYDPTSDEYYQEVDKRIRLEFPHKFDKVIQKTTQTVASANRPAQTGRKRTVRLTPSQVAIAKKLGVPLEEYAKYIPAKEA
jgi:hypothetical protein